MKKLLLFSLLTAATFHARATTTPARCTATTQAGKPCSRSAAPGLTTCKQHDATAPKCGAATQAGTPCTRHVKATGQHCKTHSTL